MNRICDKLITFGGKSMKKLQRFLALTLAVVMALAFAACNNEPAAEPDNSDPQQAGDTGINLKIIKEEDDSMINNYTLIAVKKKKKIFWLLI